MQCWLAREGETVETIGDPEDATTRLEQFRIITIPIAQRLTPGTRAARSERSEREGSPAAVGDRRIVVPLVKLRLSPEQRVHHLATLIALPMVYLNLGLRSNSGDNVDLRCGLAGNCCTACGS